MTQQHNLTAEALQRGAMPGRGYALARIISQIFHPITLSFMNVLIVGLFAMPAWLPGLGWALLCVLLQIIPPTVFFTIRLRQGIYTDEDVSVRQQRNELYLFSMGTIVVGIGVLLLLNAPLPFLALLTSGLLLSLLSWLINLIWKISVHAATIAGSATLAFLYVQPLGILLWVSALAVGWSRVRTCNHTPLQVAAGFSLATICIWGVFALFGLA